MSYFWGENFLLQVAFDVEQVNDLIYFVELTLEVCMLPPQLLFLETSQTRSAFLIRPSSPSYV